MLFIYDQERHCTPWRDICMTLSQQNGASPGNVCFAREEARKMKGVLQALTRVNPRVFDSVAALCNSPNTTVVVFSGSDKQKLEETFGKLNVWLAAENGIFMRPPQGEWSTLLEVFHQP